MVDRLAYKSCTERVCIMNVRLVCAFASNSCIGTEPAAYVEENVESENTDFRPVSAHLLQQMHTKLATQA